MERLAALAARAEAAERGAAPEPPADPDMPAWADVPTDGVPTDEEAEAALLAGLPVESVETVPQNE